ncbi:hypothetical protein MKZ38_010253 [Zalerion maritima]|uniref:Uncharacterized protein n=1 Tax=Zalerion maritima TaxID=339359 RepID=A0AAD5RU43_9PEZI|nr:hypothetical protein MKZ38_010253 [Zalerion maritima]
MASQPPSYLVRSDGDAASSPIHGPPNLDPSILTCLPGFRFTPFVSQRILRVLVSPGPWSKVDRPVSHRNDSLETIIKYRLLVLLRTKEFLAKHLPSLEKLPTGDFLDIVNEIIEMFVWAKDRFMGGYMSRTSRFYFSPSCGPVDECLELELRRLLAEADAAVLKAYPDQPVDLDDPRDEDYRGEDSSDDCQDEDSSDDDGQRGDKNGGEEGEDTQASCNWDWSMDEFLRAWDVLVKEDRVLLYKRRRYYGWKGKLMAIRDEQAKKQQDCASASRPDSQDVSHKPAIKKEAPEDCRATAVTHDMLDKLRGSFLSRFDAQEEKLESLNREVRHLRKENAAISAESAALHHRFSDI